MGLTHLADRWETLNKLFHEALELPADEREAFCVDACRGDEELLAHLRTLVASADAEDDDLHREIGELAQDAALTESSPGDRVGNYRIDELLAHGGMGDVFLASRADGEFDKTVAVKIVRRRLNAGEFVRHFRTERQVLANLSHRCIPALIDAGQTEDGRPYFVCEYIDGTPIDVYCQESSATTARRIELLVEIGEALQHAHNNLVLHLDIKPDNILVDRSGTPRLLDFGVARLMSESDKGHQAFTPEYASPEQIEGRPLSVASDVYSLGLLLYRLLAGESPVAATHLATAATKLADREQFDDALNRPGSMRGIAEDLRAIVRKATARSPAGRYGSIDALLQDLRHYRLHRPIAARSGSFGYRVGKFLRRNALVASVSVAALGLLIAFGVREADLRQQAEQAAQSSLAAGQVAQREAQAAARTAALERADLHVRIGDLLDETGRLAEGEMHYSQALAIRDSHLGADALDTAVARYKLGTLSRKRGNLEAAQALLLRAVAGLRGGLPDDHEHRVVADWQLANVYRDLGRYDQAGPLYARAFAHWQAQRAAGDPALAAMAADYVRYYHGAGLPDEARGLSIYLTQEP